MIDAAEENKQLVIQAIDSYLETNLPSSSNAHLQSIQAALKKGDKLVCDFLANGKTNYAYKVHLYKNSECLPGLFAKLTLLHPLWDVSRSKPMDLQRTENELVMMNLLSRLMQDEEWIQADHLWARHFVVGQVNRKILRKVARALAILHCTDTSSLLSLNAHIHPMREAGWARVKAQFHAFLQKDHDHEDACIKVAREIGGTANDEMIDAMAKHAQQPQALVHGDFHPFNILVESNECDKVVICDWEMAHVGSSGRDIGSFPAFPICCCIWHALLGNANEAYHMLDCLDEFWLEYARVLTTEGKKDERFLFETYRNSLGCTSIELYLQFYIFGVFAEELPKGKNDDIPEEHRAIAKATVGAIGLEFRRLAYGNTQVDLTLDALRARSRELITKNITMLLNLSTIRTTGENCEDTYNHPSTV